MDAATGNISTVAGTGNTAYNAAEEGTATANFDNPISVALDAAGNLYISDSNHHRIRRVDAATGNISTVAGTGTAGSAGDGGPATSAQLDNPDNVALDAAGNLYIADFDNHRVRKVTPAGVISTYAGAGTPGSTGDGGPAASAQLHFPAGVALDAAGNLYIADFNNHRIRKVTPAGMISTYAGTGTSGFSGDGGPATSALLHFPASVALDGADHLYITDQSNNRIRRVDAVTGNISTVAGGGTALGDNGPAASARFNSPAGITFDCAGNLYIADFNHHRIRKVTALGEPCPPPPPEPSVTEETGPAVLAQPFALSFMAAQDGEPAAQPVTLHAQGGDADFQLVPGARWISVSPRSGRLADDERTTVTVTVDPAGLPEGTRRARLYVRSGGRVTASVRVALEVLPPTGPAISENAGAVNAARMSAYGNPGLFGPQLLPLAPGSLVVVQGVNFLPAGADPRNVEDFPLPTDLSGVSVFFDGIAAPLFSVGAQRIEAQLPWALGADALAAGRRPLVETVVEAGGARSWPRLFPLGPHGPGVFTASGGGAGQALAMFAADGAPAAPRGFTADSRPARAGDIVAIYATGLGAVEPPAADGMNSCPPNGVCSADGAGVIVRRTAARPLVRIGAYELAPENVLFSGLEPNFVGVNMVIVRIPPNLPPSPAAEVTVSVGGRESQAGVTIALE